MISPAKLNLGLKILYKRPDGYHEINSVFLKINWGDEIFFESNESGKFELISTNHLQNEKKEMYDLVSEKGEIKKNILFKAFEAFQKICPNTKGIKIRIEKNIPPGGGLGGGSSNAATLLKFLSTECKFDNEGALFSTALSIGADVPFFLRDRNSFVWGIGENLRDIIVANGIGILAIPEDSINTKEAYLSLKKPLHREVGSKQWNFLQEKDLISLKNGDWGALSDRFENDFEEFAFSKYPTLGEIKKGFLKLGASFASMTGSGSCIYCFAGSENQSMKIFTQMQEKYPFCKFVHFSF